MPLALCVLDRQFEKHGSASDNPKATMGKVVTEVDDDDSFLSKLTSLKRKIFG